MTKLNIHYKANEDNFFLEILLSCRGHHVSIIYGYEKDEGFLYKIFICFVEIDVCQQ